MREMCPCVRLKVFFLKKIGKHFLRARCPRRCGTVRRTGGVRLPSPRPTWHRLGAVPSLGIPRRQELVRAAAGATPTQSSSRGGSPVLDDITEQQERLRRANPVILLLCEGKAWRLIILLFCISLALARLHFFFFLPSYSVNCSDLFFIFLLAACLLLICTNTLLWISIFC